jgi:hypothetical protein
VNWPFCIRVFYLSGNTHFANGTVFGGQVNLHPVRPDLLAALLVECHPDSISVQLKPLDAAIAGIALVVALNVVCVHAQSYILLIVFICTLKHKVLLGREFLIREADQQDVFHILDGDTIGVETHHRPLSFRPWLKARRLLTSGITVY